MRDNTPIVGDLVEEYREVIRPARGRLRAALWFTRQLASLVRPWVWGTLLGVTLGVLNILSTIVAPLAEDEPPLILGFAATILGLWTLIGFAAEGQRFRMRDAVFGGISAAAVSTMIFSGASLVRKMVFLDVIRQRLDWQGMLQRFQDSGSPDLRSFVLNEHLEGLFGALLFSIAIGAACGAIGGAISASRRARARVPTM